MLRQVVLPSPITTEGDLLIGGTGGAQVRLPKGTKGQEFTIRNNRPYWHRKRYLDIHAEHGFVEGPTQDNTSLILMAISDLDDDGGGEWGFAGVSGFRGLIEHPTGVGFVGAGSGFANPGTTLVCLDANARLLFEGTGGIFGNFLLDANDVASQPFKMGTAIRSALPIDIVGAPVGSVAALLDRTQNSFLQELNFSDCHGDLLVFDGGAASNYIVKSEFGGVDAGYWGIKFRTTYTVAEGAIFWYPYDNLVCGRGLVEYGVGGGAVYFGAGVNNIVRDCNLNRNSVTQPEAVVEWRLDDLIRDVGGVPTQFNVNQNNRIEGGQIVGVQAQTTAFKVGAGCGAWLGRGVQVAAHNKIWDVDAGATYVRTDGEFDIAFYNTRWASPNGALENLFLYEKTHASRRRILPSLADLADSWQVEGEPYPRLRVFTNGTIQFGDGANPTYNTVSRAAAGYLMSDAAWWHQRATATDPAIYANVVGDVGARATMDHAGVWQYGDGTNPPDVVTARWAANYWGTFLGTTLAAGYLGTGAWNSGHMTIGPYHLWFDALGVFRCKNGAPTSDTDGVVIGSQT